MKAKGSLHGVRHEARGEPDAHPLIPWNSLLTLGLWAVPLSLTGKNAAKNLTLSSTGSLDRVLRVFLIDKCLVP